MTVSNSEVLSCPEFSAFFAPAINSPRVPETYQRMRAERDAVAREHRSQGKEKAAFIQADVDRKVTLILANANKTALSKSLRI